MNSKFFSLEKTIFLSSFYKFQKEKHNERDNITIDIIYSSSDRGYKKSFRIIKRREKKRIWRDFTKNIFKKKKEIQFL